MTRALVMAPRVLVGALVLFAIVFVINIVLGRAGQRRIGGKRV